ncbi:PP2C family protein-serine/threonine phosphatase [Nocardiopsis sp. HUAS JQ3]|uniref:PP2C family protein-serine/threonine phosphatase n=1 Tax=Nocardiopsis sp. HUAS JQ3 TaxID=3061629 RepID=UPI0023A999D0|nr:SpoIIE family protein phosphatase [Nocardiopsis sp. HUAS JQ3]WDZ88779.1 SpoIIE family protein phosphatase [Nocardiopsis sp. HUAS JQ3]
MSGETGPPGAGNGSATDAALSALLEDSAEELYESAPCGYLSTLMDGTVTRINATLLRWLGLERAAVVGRMRFTDLLTVGGRLYHETHFAPLLHLRGEVNGIALEMRSSDGGRLPVLVSSSVKRDGGGQPLLVRTTVFDATDRRSYEEELLRRRKEAEQARAEAERAREEAEEAHRRAEADRARLGEALVILQRALLPDTLPDVPGMEAAAYYHTASPYRLGGDFYDLFPLGDGRWAFFLGDVSGKGPEAATLTSQVRYVLRTTALHSPEPADALGTLNTALLERYADNGDPRYCTAVFGVLEPDGDAGRVRARLAFGGHPPALALRGDGRAEFLFASGGMLVGVLPDAHFATVETTLAPGDTFVLYTDGLTEARTGAGPDTMYGEEALLSFAARHAPSTADGVVGALTELLEGLGEGLEDDTAILALGVPAPSGPGHHTMSGPP